VPLLPLTVWQQGTGTELHVWSCYCQQCGNKGQGYIYGAVTANSVAARDRATCVELLPPPVWQQGTGTGLHVGKFWGALNAFVVT
jgi:hypothetical protein